MFKNYKGNQVRVKMMEITDYFKYCDDKVNRVHVIFIPLEYPSMYGVVVLPKGRVIIKSTIKYIDFKRMGNWFANSHQTKINLQLPKFKILNKIDFKSVLKHFDVSLLFTKNKANLGNMMMDQGYMNDYFQISSLDITEGGSYVDPIPPKKKRFSKTADVNFHVTRPFIFSIFENKLNLTIFMSAILDPSKKDEIE
ncbi:Serpin B11 [Thelohanellus kitauei]|uniref:Serpin B11 n=1 Tax=Thelohanellus kitauei TaxID=669202 RepID=A0A0C2MIV5_THEKT|nr:Serpin B11 [Thelohanellus kitauei]